MLLQDDQHEDTVLLQDENVEDMDVDVDEDMEDSDVHEPEIVIFISLNKCFLNENIKLSFLACYRRP